MELPTPQYPNSAGRLLAVLESIEPNYSFIDQFPKLFFPEVEITPRNVSGVQDDRAFALTSEALRELHKLYSDFVADLNELDSETRGNLFDGLKSLREIVYPVQINAAPRAPSGAELALLKVAASQLPKEPFVKPDEIRELREMISDLQSAIEDSQDLEKRVRIWLLDLVRLMRDGLDRYQTRGTRGLQKTFHEMLGNLMCHKEYAAKVQKKNANIAAKVSGVFDLMVKLTVLKEYAGPMLDFVQGFLPSA